MTKLSLFRTGALVAASLGALTMPAYAAKPLKWLGRSPT
ncbi:MAG: hypothetical protein ACI93G_000088 [Hyphomonas sp.]|jgi:hypothetical protein